MAGASVMIGTEVNVDCVVVMQLAYHGAPGTSLARIQAV